MEGILFGTLLIKITNLCENSLLLNSTRVICSWPWYIFSPGINWLNLWLIWSETSPWKCLVKLRISWDLCFLLRFSHFFFRSKQTLNEIFHIIFLLQLNWMICNERLFTTLNSLSFCLELKFRIMFSDNIIIRFIITWSDLSYLILWTHIIALFNFALWVGLLSLVLSIALIS